MLIKLRPGSNQGAERSRAGSNQGAERSRAGVGPIGSTVIDIPIASCTLATPRKTELFDLAYAESFFNYANL